LVRRPFQVAPIRGGALPPPAHDRDKLAKGIAKKSGRGTRRPRATIFSYNQSRAERKFNFFGWPERHARAPSKPGVRTWTGGKDLEM